MPPFFTLTLDLPSLAHTERLGRALARATRAHADAIATSGLRVNLDGDLGSGKTALVRAWLRALGVSGPVRSPSFAVLEPYRLALAALPRKSGLEAEPISSLDFYHFDFYRFASPAEFAAGFREHFGPGAICAVEWPDRAGDRLPPADIAIALEVRGDGRSARLRAATELGDACLRSAATEFAADAA